MRFHFFITTTTTNDSVHDCKDVEIHRNGTVYNIELHNKIIGQYSDVPMYNVILAKPGRIWYPRRKLRIFLRSGAKKKRDDGPIGHSVRCHLDPELDRLRGYAKLAPVISDWLPKSILARHSMLYAIVSTYLN